MVNQYKYKFYLNANHSIFINNVLGQVHPHTWEIMIEVLNTKENFVQFDKVETVISQIFERYQDQYINTIEPFNTVNPTLENMVYHFKRMIEEQIKEYYMILLSIEISETPSRSYIINSYDEVEGKYLNMNKYANDEESFIEQIVRENMEEPEEYEEYDKYDVYEENNEDDLEEKVVTTKKKPEKKCSGDGCCKWAEVLMKQFHIVVVVFMIIVLIAKLLKRRDVNRAWKEAVDLLKSFNVITLSRE